MEKSDVLWVVLAAALVFFMQAGFKVLETGLVPEKDRSSIGVKNLLDWIAGIVAFFAIGFGLMFGESFLGFFGSSLFLGEGLSDPNGNELGIFFFLFQLAFAGTALTIISGAMSGRTGVVPYFVVSMLTAVFIYPVFGHWVWGDAFYSNNTAWLSKLGFIDFAGSTVVHSLGAWVGLVGMYVVGPRIGRYDINGTILPKKASDYSYSILGVMILWLGWWGFNGGSTLELNASVGQIILNTNLAGALAALTAYVHCLKFQDPSEAIEKLIGGTLGGLVAVTAGCHILTPLSSCIVGVGAGLVHNYGYDLLIKKWKLDDPVGAVPVHGFCGAFGTLVLAFLAPSDLINLPRVEQIVVQLIGILLCFGFSGISAFLVFSLLKRYIGLRLSPEEELNGYFIRSQQKERETNQRVSEVAIQVSAKGFNLISAAEFLQMPLEKRLALSRENRIQYLDDQGIRMQELHAVQQLTKADDYLPAGASTEQKEEYDQLDTSDADFGLRETFDDYFVLSIPTSQEPQNLYWFGEKEEFVLIAVAEIKDQSFPASMVNMLGVTFVNQVVHKDLNTFTQASDVHKMLSDKFSKGLETEEGLNTAGRLNICLIDRKKKVLQFAGDQLPVFFMGSKLAYGLNEYNSIPYHESFGTIYQLKPAKNLQDVAEEELPLVSEKITYNPGDRIYIGTDGFPDQKGVKDELYTKSRLKRFILDIQEDSMKRQEAKLKDNFFHWKGQNPQGKDVLLIGATLV